jgi:hypothetical protein
MRGQRRAHCVERRLWGNLSVPKSQRGGPIEVCSHVITGYFYRNVVLTRFRLAILLLTAVSTVSAQSTAAKPAPASWVGTWAASPFDGDPWHTIPTLVESTLREIVHTSIAGKSVRVRLTNEFGTESLRIDAATIAISAGVSSIDATSLHDLTFGGSPSIVIPPGAQALTDPVAMATPASANLAISIYLPLQQISDVTVHSSAQQDNFIQTGNHVRDDSLAEPVITPSWFFLKGVDVEPANAHAAAIVALATSISELACCRQLRFREPPSMKRGKQKRGTKMWTIDFPVMSDLRLGNTAPVWPITDQSPNRISDINLSHPPVLARVALGPLYMT